MIEKNIAYDFALIEEKFSIIPHKKNLLGKLINWWKYRPRKCSLPKSYKFVDKNCMENPNKEKLQFIIDNKRKIRIPIKILTRTYPTRVIETTALIDTGAECCMISDNLIEKLQLKPYKKDVQMFHSDGESKTNVYECDMALSDNTIFYGSEFYRSAILGNHEPADILIGMEALCRCEFSFKKENEKFVFELELRDV